VYTVIAGLPGPSWKSRQLWGCLEQPDGDGGPHTHTVSPIFDENPAAGWVQVAMKLTNPKLFHVIYCGQHSEGISGAQSTLWGGYRYLPLDNILPLRAEDMIDNIEKESDDDDETRHPNRTSFWMTKTCFHQFGKKLPRRITDRRNSLKSSETMILVSLPIRSKALLLMRMWHGYVSTITLWILLLGALWPIWTVQAASQLQISQCEDGMHWLDGCSRICVAGAYFPGTLDGGRMGNNLEFFGDVLGLI